MKRCKDVWKMAIPPNKLEVYKQMIQEGLISNPHVTYYKGICMTIVEYDTDQPQEWIREEMRKRVNHLPD